MRPHLVALDLDGTLLSTRRGISPGHRRAVAGLRERGIEVVIVTGRPLLTARDPWSELGLDNELVCFNGVWIGHPDRGATEHACLSADEAAGIVADLAPHDGVINVYPDTATWLMDHASDRTCDWSEVYGVPIACDASIRSGWKRPSFKVMFVAEPPVVRRLSAELAERHDGRYHVVSSEPDRFEIHRAHATKAWGLQRLAEARGIPRERVWACGDGDNDREMLAWAGRGFAMAGASQYLRSAADDHLPAAEEDGLLALLERMDALG